MNILLIWIGEQEPLDEWRNKCVSQVKMMYPRAKFNVITKLKEFYGMNCIHPETFPVGVSTDDYISYSDYARLKWLSENEDTLYIDTDTWCVEPYKFTDKMGSAFFEAIWSGKETQKIKAVYDKAEGRTLMKLGQDLDKSGENLHKYFDHRPKWARVYRGFK
jgi:hypothetical protein